MKNKERNWLEYCKTKNLCPYLGIHQKEALKELDMAVCPHCGLCPYFQSELEELRPKRKMKMKSNKLKN